MISATSSNGSAKRKTKKKNVRVIILAMHTYRESSKQMRHNVENEWSQMIGLNLGR